MHSVQDQELEELEIDLLLEGVYQRFGHDFRGYRREPLRLLLRAFMEARGLETVSALQARILHDDAAGDQLLRALTRRQSALFGDPAHFTALREVLGPWLRSRPMPKVWVAECSTAEDVFSLAVLLQEEDLLERTRIFATSANESLLQEASRGAFPVEMATQYAQNYQASGGRSALSDYYTVENGECVFLPALRANITWAQYQLASDASFNEFELIMCRNTLDAFGPGLTRRSLQLFHDSLARFGILSVDGIDNPETIPFIAGYTSLLRKEGLYRRVA